MRANEGTSELDLRHYFRVLRSRKWIVLLTVGALLGLALVSSILQTPVYKATAQLLITPKTATTSVFNSPSGAPADPTRAIQTQIQIITSRAVRDLVKKQLGKAPPVSAAPVGQTDVVAVAASSTSPTEAATLANAYANSYVTFERTQAVDSLLAAGDQIQGKVKDLQKQIDTLDAQIAAVAPKDRATAAAEFSSQRDSLVTQQAQFKQRLDQLQVDASLTTGQAQLVTPATTPTAPSSPRPARSAALALVVGLILGVGLAFLVDYLDDSVRSREDVDRATHGLPNLGLIPRVAGWKNSKQPQVVSMDEPMSPAAEAYRTLRTSIQFVGLDHAARIIQVTSPNAEEGKSTTLANLGVALAGSGESVCLCCCDLRRPRIHDFFGLDNRIGFTSVILGQTSIDDALQEVPGAPGMWLLASGPLPSNPSELLASSRAAEVIALLTAKFDVVLLDCSPVLPVTDAAVIAAHAEATVLVVGMGDSTRREISRAIEILEQVDAPLIGAVLNGISADGSEGYYRHYRQTAPSAYARSGDLIGLGPGGRNL